MAIEEFIESVGRRSEKTADAYQRGLDLFALCHHVDSLDLLVTRIKAGKLNQYQLLDKFISFMSSEGYAPKSIWGYVSAVKSFYGYEEVDLDDRKFKIWKVINIKNSCHTFDWIGHSQSILA